MPQDANDFGGGVSHRPTRALRESVATMKGDGWADARIARVLRISRTTLLKHYPDELEYGADMARLILLDQIKKSAKAGNASAQRMMLDILAKGGMPTRENPKGNDPTVDPPPSKKTKLGKKEQEKLDATTPDTTTTMGRLMAQRQGLLELKGKPN